MKSINLKEGRKGQEGMKQIILSGLMVLAVVACTKEKPYEELPKENVLEKALIDTKADYIFLASSGESKRTASANRPFWQGQEALVRLQFGENDLKVVRIDKDERFQGNTTNNTTILSIPVSHIGFQCRKDSNGNCTNSEEEMSKVSWKDRPQFKPSFASMVESEVPLLPVQIENLFGPCYNEIGSEVVNYDISPDGLNIEVEKTYKGSIDCAQDVEEISDLTFQVRNFYSVIKVSRLASKDYKPVLYQSEDEGTFGFFTTEQKRLDVDNRDVVKSLQVVMNRWSPDRGELVYHLSDAFAKPENKAIKDATYHAVKVINESLKAAGTSLTINLKEPSGKKPGDLRNSMIVLVEDPVSSGVIGYGPSVANPLTGEIVQARTVMYLGVIKKTIRRTYDEIIKSLISQANSPIDAGPVGGGNGGNPVSQISLDTSGLGHELFPRSIKAKPVVKNPAGSQPGGSLGSNPNFGISQAGLKEVEKMAHGKSLQTQKTTKLADRIEALSKVCGYPAELVNFHEAIEKSLPQVLEVAGGLKTWDQLNDSQKDKILNILVPYVWVPTLVHEIGHNLGLRHNFAGSEDKANFYTKEELSSMGIQRPITYASIMDYSYRTLNELPVMGKYDVAALRYAYKREVETADGKVINLKSTLQDLKKELADQGADISDVLKSYRYCTDEHVSANAMCKRFDEGTSYTEVAQQLANAYKESYKRGNFRNNRRSFSLFGEAGHIAGIKNSFEQLRIFFETRERIDRQFSPTPQQWQTIPILKDIDAAARVAGDLYLDVLTTPDVHCAIAAKANPTKILAFLPLGALAEDNAMGCLGDELRLNPNFIAVGEFGKSIRSKKSKDNENAFADQIDIRGVWADKILAAHFLLARTLDSTLFDKYQGNFLEFADYGSKISSVFGDVLRDRLAREVEVELADGSKMSVEAQFGLTMDGDHENLIQLVRGGPTERALYSPYDPTSNISLEVGSTFSVQKQLMKQMKKLVPSLLSGTPAADKIAAQFQVHAYLPSESSPSEFEILDAGSRKFLAKKGVNILAQELIQSVKIVDLLNALSDEDFEKLQKRVDAGEITIQEGDSEGLVAVLKMPKNLIVAALSNELQSKEYYIKTLGLMPQP